MNGRTVITITHRLNTIMHADKIFVLKTGLLLPEATTGIDETVNSTQVCFAFMKQHHKMVNCTIFHTPLCLGRITIYWPRKTGWPTAAFNTDLCAGINNYFAAGLFQRRLCYRVAISHQANTQGQCKTLQPILSNSSSGTSTNWYPRAINKSRTAIGINGE